MNIRAENKLVESSTGNYVNITATICSAADEYSRLLILTSRTW